MIQHVQPERPQAERHRELRADAAFKPLALPALAAAVHATRLQPRRVKVQDLPPILRKDATVG